MADIHGEIRITAATQEEAEEIAGYLNRISGGAVWFYRPREGRREWLVYGEVDVPPEHDTRTWRKDANENGSPAGD